MLEAVVRRSVQASAAALGAALALLPAPTAHEAAPRPASPPAAPRPVDPLAAHVLERMPSLTVDDAAGLASAVRTESQAAGLDPVLVMAVIGVESGWEPTAVSERGARGLMQLRSGALTWAEREGGLSAGDVHDPVHNVRAGIRYLARLVETFDDLDLALIAYNAGPTRLASYLQAVGEVPDSMWGYVRKVHREERRIRRGLLRPQVLVADAAG
jgi:soluble lytic murein transglycosylase-like protein